MNLTLSTDAVMGFLDQLDAATKALETAWIEDRPPTTHEGLWLAADAKVAYAYLRAHLQSTPDERKE